MSKKIVVAGVASGLACLVPLTALAQAAAAAASPASAASAPSLEIARVIITAQKRKEDIQGVPVSVSVVSAEQLKASQINTVEDLTRNVPNISFSTQAGPGLGTVEIRGVSSQAGSATVSTYLDDVSLNTRNLYSTGTAEPHFFDLENVEVLRGPQGTLYGASSLGGTIKYVSKQPDLKSFGASASAQTSYTEHGGANYQAEGVINVPVIKDKLAIRIGVQRGHDSGYIDQVDPSTNAVVSKGINSQDWTLVKASAKAAIEPGWTIEPALFAQLTNTADIDAAYTGLAGRYQASKLIREPGHDRLVVPSVTINGEMPVGTLTAVLSGYQRRFDRKQDGTYINDPSYAVLHPDSYPGLTDALDALTSTVYLNNKIDQTSLEVRLASKDYDPKNPSLFTWIGGLYVSDATTQVYDDEPIPGVSAVFAQYGFNPGDSTQMLNGFAGDFGNDDSYYSARHYHDKQASGFGEVTFHPTTTIAATAGLRYIDARQHFTREGNYFYNLAKNSAVIDTGNTAWTPSFKVSWAVDPSTSLYANVSKGFRLGGANRPVPANQKVLDAISQIGLPGLPPKSFAPDSLWNYEVGSKSSLWDRRVTFNVSAFVLKWKNIQQDVALGSSGFDFETNTGNATSYGLEADLQARVTENLTLKASGGLTHATFDSDVPDLGRPLDDDGNQDTSKPYNVRKGDQLQGVPVATANIGADYHWAINDGVGAFVRANAQWTGKSHGQLLRSDPDHNRPSYVVFDASAGVNFDKWEFTAFVKNAANNHTAIQHPTVQYVPEAYYLRPRTIGVSGNYEF
jgi:iron complex outermembrane receptor protein